jgi:hypothetical protein
VKNHLILGHKGLLFKKNKAFKKPEVELPLILFLGSDKSSWTREPLAWIAKGSQSQENLLDSKFKSFKYTLTNAIIAGSTRPLKGLVIVDNLTFPWYGKIR